MATESVVSVAEKPNQAQEKSLRVVVENCYVQTIGVSAELREDKTHREVVVQIHSRTNNESEVYKIGPKQTLVINEDEEDETT